MCGRFGLFVTPEVLEEYFGLDDLVAAVEPRYNLTPGRAVAVVRESEGKRRLDALQWGLIPFWAKDATIARRLINARLDGVAEKPAYREAWQRRRCGSSCTRSAPNRRTAWSSSTAARTK